MKNIIWLSSYPRSGNTWLRILLESILLRQGETVDLNHLKLAFSSKINRKEFDAFLGLQSSDLSPEETWSYLRTYYVRLNKAQNEQIFLKTHDANLKINAHQTLIPEEATQLAVYIVRNPLDIVASLANHLGIGIDRSIQLLNSPSFLPFHTNGFKSTIKVYSKSGSWSEHVTSWLNQTNFPVHIIKYEELKLDPIKVLNNLLNKIKLSVNPSIVSKAVKNATFEKLATLEATNGFAERPSKSKVFFRKGDMGNWCQELNQDQILRIRNDHALIMKKMGYL